MKIYNRIVLDMATWQVLEEDSFDYDGPLSLCDGGGTTVEAPAPSATEELLRQKQLANMTKSEQLTNALLPYILKEQGLVQVIPDVANNPEYQRLKSLTDEYTRNWQNAPPGSAEAAEWDRKNREVWAQMQAMEAPTYRQMTEEERYAAMSPAERDAEELRKMQSARLKLAYEGKLPISPAMTKKYDEEQAALEEILAREYGADWRRSSGAKRHDDFLMSRAISEDAAARGEISSGNQILLSQMGLLDNINKGQAAGLSSIPNITLPLVSGYNSLLSPYEKDRAMTFQADTINANNEAASDRALIQGITSMLGTAGGIGFGAYMKGGGTNPSTKGYDKSVWV